MATRKESLLCQKSIVKWIKEGDSNTSYFHYVANWKRMKSSIKGIFKEGVWLEDLGMVKKETREFFMNRFTEKGGMRPKLDGVPFERLTTHNNTLLVALFEKDEIKSVVWDCDGSKCLGPDEFNFKFIKKSWDLMKGEIIRMMAEFHANGKWPKGSI